MSTNIFAEARKYLLRSALARYTGAVCQADPGPGTELSLALANR